MTGSNNHSRVDIAVIGAGVAGLATAHHLARSGFVPTVFDRNSVPGGRFSTLEIEGTWLNQGALLYAPAIYPNFHALIQSLGIDLVKVGLHKLLLRVGDNETAMHSWGLFRSGLFTMEEFRTWKRLKRFIRRLRFDPGDPHPDLERLHSLDFLTYLREHAGFNDKLINYFAQPFCSWAYSDPQDIAADYGLLFFAFPVFQGIRAPKYGMQAVTDRLARGLPVKPRLGHKLVRLEIEGDGSARLFFKVRLQDGGFEDREIGAKCVVFANGKQSVLGKLLPGLDFQVTCSKTRGVVIECRSPGLRPYRLLLYGKHGNTHGVHGGELCHLPDGRTLGGIFLYRSDADIEAQFPGHKLLGRVGWSPAISISTPGCSFPDVDTQFPSVFVVGDFYRYPSIESCAYTARRAAGYIRERARSGKLDLQAAHHMPSVF
jgi:glycine/D-amino acid oxidase-like deaminating enzyme